MELSMSFCLVCFIRYHYSWIFSYLTHPRRAAACSLRWLHIVLEREIMKWVLISIKLSFFLFVVFVSFLSLFYFSRICKHSGMIFRLIGVCSRSEKSPRML